MPEQPAVHVHQDTQALSAAAAQAIIRVATAAIRHSGRCAVALAGGETPRAAYGLLGSRYAGAVDWARVHVFFTDERFVPPDDTRSNFAMARRAWLSRVPIPPGQVHAIPTTGGTPAECADLYQETLRECFPHGAEFDCAVMGIGRDGHTASLFPGDAAALSERDRWTLAVVAPPGTDPRERITLTLPVLNSSRHVLFLATGVDKRERVAQALSGDQNIPAARVHGRDSTEWMIDAAAS